MLSRPVGQLPRSGAAPEPIPLPRFPHSKASNHTFAFVMGFGVVGVITIVLCTYRYFARKQDYFNDL